MKTRRWLAVLITVLLAVSLAGQIWAAAANDTLDLNRECTLTVNPCDKKAQGHEEMAADLAGADIVVDLYKVADWKVEGTLYGFTPVEPFDLNISQDITNEGWAELAQEAAKTVLTPPKEPDKSADSGDEVTLKPGVYLLVAHKRGDTDFVKTIKDKEGNSRIVTQVKTGTSVYTFNPELVALPSKRPGESGINTANPGEWLYDLEVNLKPERDDLKGKLEIIKTLKTYETSAPATFVFQIDWEENGEHRSVVQTITFTEPGQRSLKVENLPVGAEVTVKEVYSGATYVLITDPEQTVTIKADEIAQVSFENDYDETHNNGGAITNKFTYDDGWKVEKLVDNTGEYDAIE